MREIKFRAWMKDTKVMISHEDNMDMPLEYSAIFGINPKYPIMQYAEIKDKNGKEIYEGDILGRCFDDYDENCVVKYKNGMLMLKTIRSKATRPCNIDRGFGWSELKNYVHYRNGFEVIGNIYENPELLDSNS